MPNKKLDKPANMSSDKNTILVKSITLHKDKKRKIGTLEKNVHTKKPCITNKSNAGPSGSSSTNSVSFSDLTHAISDSDSDSFEPLESRPEISVRRESPLELFTQVSDDENNFVTHDVDTDATRLENILLAESNDNDLLESDSDHDIPIIGNEDDSTWVVPKRAFNWFNKIADLELSDSKIDECLADFIPPEDVAHHFEPPMLPSVIWNKVRHGNAAELQKQRTIFRSQKLLSSSLMPLLTALDSMNKHDPNQKLIASAIQLISTSNLQLSRFRRATIAKFIIY